jgi:putative membrane protein
VTLAHAHGGAGATGLWTAWALDPFVLVLLGAAALLYWRGSLRLRGREACFAAGMAMLFFALVWPLDALGEQLFSAHMAQHMVLMNLAAPLLVLGAPMGAMLRAMARPWRRALARLAAAGAWRAGWGALSGVAVATALQQAALWAWHTPAGVAAALESDAVHVAMHATLLAAALLFWSAILRPRSGSLWAPIAGLLATLKASGVVCIMLMLQPGPLYPAYGDRAAAWGLAPGADEQLGWGLMMALGTLSYLAAGVALFGLALGRLERPGGAS